MIEQSEIDELKAYTDIVAIAENYGTKLDQSGRSFVGCCLFHSERTASMHVYPDQASYYCFGCGASGDVINMIQEKQQVEFIDAVRILANETGYTPKGLTDTDGKELEAKEPPPKPEPRVKPDGRDKWMPILPVPEKLLNAQLELLKYKNYKTGVTYEPSKRWPYSSAKGELLGYDVRYDYYAALAEISIGDVVAIAGTDIEGEVTKTAGPTVTLENGEIYPVENCRGKAKKVITWTVCQHKDTGEIKWHHRRFIAPAPLYGLDRLEANPDDTVIIAEGCKDADAANEIDGHVGVTWCGGAQSINNYDSNNWRPLNGRNVIIWPDADQPGIDATWHLVEHLRQAGAASIRIVNTSDLPKGWGLADDIP